MHEKLQITNAFLFSKYRHLPLTAALTGLHTCLDYLMNIYNIAYIGGGRGQWLGGTMASAEHELITGVWGQSPWSGGLSPPEAESILAIGCPKEPANLAPVSENSVLCYGPLLSELGGPECTMPPNPVIGGCPRLRRL